MVNPELDCIFPLAVNDLCAFAPSPAAQQPSSRPMRGGIAAFDQDRPLPAANRPAKRRYEVACRTSPRIQPHPSPDGVKACRKRRHPMRPAHEQIRKSSKAFFQWRRTSVRRADPWEADEADQQQRRSTFVLLQKRCVMQAAPGKMTNMPGTIPAIRGDEAKRPAPRHPGIAPAGGDRQHRQAAAAGLPKRPTGIVRLFPPAGYQGFHDGALRENSAP